MPELTTIHINQIDVPEDRQRQHFDEKALAELTDSIREQGILQPIVVNRTDNPDRFLLLCGERRIRAAKTAGLELVPAQVFAFDTVLEQQEAELAENLIRQDLTWQEKAKALAALHELRSAQSAARGGPEQTFQKTAEEVAGKPNPHGGVRAEVKQAATLFKSGAMEKDEIKSAPSLKEAWKRYAKDVTSVHAQALADLAVKSENKLINAKFQDVAAEIPDASFDCCIVDPPYGIGVADFGDAATNPHKYSEEGFGELHKDLFDFLNAKLKPAAHLFLFCDLKHFPQWSVLLDVDGWTVRRVPIIWYKGTMGHMTESRETGFRRTYEAILLAHRGGRPFLGVSDDVIIRCPAEQKRDHAAQKPVLLYSALLEMSTLPGDSVIDPCAGSGPLIPAAHKAHVRATAIEPSEEYFKLIKTREGLLHGAVAASEQ